MEGCFESSSDHDHVSWPSPPMSYVCAHYTLSRLSGRDKTLLLFKLNSKRSRVRAVYCPLTLFHDFFDWHRADWLSFMSFIINVTSNFVHFWRKTTRYFLRWVHNSILKSFGTVVDLMISAYVFGASVTLIWMSSYFCSNLPMLSLIYLRTSRIVLSSRMRCAVLTWAHASWSMMSIFLSMDSSIVIFSALVSYASLYIICNCNLSDIRDLLSLLHKTSFDWSESLHCNIIFNVLPRTESQNHQCPFCSSI